MSGVNARVETDSGELALERGSRKPNLETGFRQDYAAVGGMMI